MYQKFFGLKEAPFGLTPDTSFFYANADHQEALNTLLVALQMGEGFIKVSGEVGTGKTLVCRKLLDELHGEPRFITAYIPNPALTPAALRFSLASELGLRVHRNKGQSEVLEQVNEFLLTQKAEGRQVVLLVDEAQALSADCLETVRLLTNLETEKSKLLQVVLFGQPELDERLARHELRQLRQRITFSYRLSPMKPEVVAGYLAHRLAVAGYRGPPLFSLALAARLHKASGGIPRLLNVLAHKTLLAAFGDGKAVLSKHHLLRAVKDTESVHDQPGGRFARWFGAASASLAAAGLLWTTGLG